MNFLAGIEYTLEVFTVHKMYRSFISNLASNDIISYYYYYYYTDQPMQAMRYSYSIIHYLWETPHCRDENPGSALTLVQQFPRSLYRMNKFLIDLASLFYV